MMGNESIDIVVCWVDGSDEAWQEEMKKHSDYCGYSTRDYLFRDWGTLKYWFRGIEKYAFWVNKIHFVTWGHTPEWLNLSHPKLNIVRHEDYIPEDFLPTFSSHVLELNLHRINGLSEQFVFFNDDIFLNKPVSEADFFQDNKPCDIGVIDVGIKSDEIFGGAVYNSIRIINKYFKKRQMIRKNLLKWYNPVYGLHIYKTLLLMPWKLITGFYTPHLANAFLKSAFREVWQKEEEALEETCNNKFRTSMDLNQCLIKYWQLASGNFIRRGNMGKEFDLGRNSDPAFQALRKQKLKVICLNDSGYVENFAEVKHDLINAFEEILPEKCSYEL